MSRRRLRHWLRPRVASRLEPRAAAAAAAAAHLTALRRDADALDRRLAALASRLGHLHDELCLLGQPFSAGMTVDQAWRRHPGAPGVFAQHHLPACDGCAVRFDETLDEAAAAYGLSLVSLLSDLNALL